MSMLTTKCMRQNTNLNSTGSCSSAAKNVQISSFLHSEFLVDSLFKLNNSNVKTELRI